MNRVIGLEFRWVDIQYGIEEVCLLPLALEYPSRRSCLGCNITVHTSAGDITLDSRNQGLYLPCR